MQFACPYLDAQHLDTDNHRVGPNDPDAQRCLRRHKKADEEFGRFPIANDVVRADWRFGTFVRKHSTEPWTPAVMYPVGYGRLLVDQLAFVDQATGDASEFGKLFAGLDKVRLRTFVRRPGICAAGRCLEILFRLGRSISVVMSMPMAFPFAPTFDAARKTSSPPPHPRSTTTSPGRRFAVAVGLPHDRPMLACDGMEASSSGV